MHDPALRSAIEDLVAEFAWLVDHGRAAEVAELFTDDGRFAGPGLDLVGRERIREAFAQRAALDRTSRHVLSNLRLVPDGPDRARGTLVLTLYRHDGGGTGPAQPVALGDYDDVYVREPDGRWRFAERRFTAVFSRADRPRRT